MATARFIQEMPVIWQGPSFGFDYGADGARTMMLVYNLPQTGATCLGIHVLVGERALAQP